MSCSLKTVKRCAHSLVKHFFKLIISDFSVLTLKGSVEKNSLLYMIANIETLICAPNESTKDSILL